MRVLFDTSAINRLLKDPDAQHIIKGVEAAGQIWVSALNVAEASATANDDKRSRLFELLKAMAHGRRPLEMPTKLVSRAVASYSKRDRDFVYTVEGGNEIAWHLICEPEALTPSARDAMAAALRAEQEAFVRRHRSARADLQLRLQASRLDRPDRASALRGFCADEQFLFETIDETFREETGVALTPGTAKDLLVAAPELAAFLLGWAHAIYQQAVQLENFGANSNAGIIDIWFATYLPRLTWFVTNDKPQYRALRMVAMFFQPRCRVMLYDNMRRRVLLEP